MKVGDLVSIDGIVNVRPEQKGVIVGFNEKGEGGKDYVHVLVDGEVSVFMKFVVEVINEAR